jgi:hypothetical protein
MSHTTIEELIAAWDRGETISTLEMGGIGPGYEQAIQLAAVEFSRHRAKLAPNDDREAAWKAWDEICTEALRPIDKSLGGLTGAMFGAAKWLSWRWCFEEGPEGLLEAARKQGHGSRVILCSKFAPTVV